MNYCRPLLLHLQMCLFTPIRPPFLQFLEDDSPLSVLEQGFTFGLASPLPHPQPSSGNCVPHCHLSPVPWCWIFPLCLWRRLQHLLFLSSSFYTISFSLLGHVSPLPAKPNISKSCLPLFPLLFPPSHSSTWHNLLSSSSPASQLSLRPLGTSFCHSTVCDRVFWCSWPGTTTSFQNSVARLLQPFSFLVPLLLLSHITLLVSRSPASLSSSCLLSDYFLYTKSTRVHLHPDHVILLACPAGCRVKFKPLSMLKTNVLHDLAPTPSPPPLFSPFCLKLYTLVYRSGFNQESRTSRRYILELCYRDLASMIVRPV